MAAKTKLDAKTLSRMVDELGTIRAQKKILETRETAITTKIKEIAGVGETVFGERFSAELCGSSKRVVNVQSAFKLLGQKVFLTVCTVPITALKKILSDNDIDNISETEPGPVSVRTNLMPGAVPIVNSTPITDTVEI